MQQSNSRGEQLFVLITEFEKQHYSNHANDSFTAFQLMECCVNALVTSFKETILAECQGMIKRNETESK